MRHAVESDVLLVDMMVIDGSDERLLDNLRRGCVWGLNPPVNVLLIRVSYSSLNSSAIG